MKCSAKAPGKSPGLKAKEICQDIVERKVEIFNSFSVIQHMNIHEQLRENFLSLNKIHAQLHIAGFVTSTWNFFRDQFYRHKVWLVEDKEKRLLQGNRRHLEFDLDIFCTFLVTQKNLLSNIYIKEYKKEIDCVQPKIL